MNQPADKSSSSQSGAGGSESPASAGRRKQPKSVAKPPAPKTSGKLAEHLSGGLSWFVRWLIKDPLATFLLSGAIVLTILFFSLLGSIQPSSSGEQLPLSQAITLAQSNRVGTAILLDYDSRVVLKATDGQTFWSAYPQSDAQTSNVIRQLTAAGVVVDVDQQSFKAERAVIVQFLIPILLLVCLFAYFTRVGQGSGTSGFADFSKFAGRSRKKGKEDPNRIGFDMVAGAGEAINELKEIRDYLADPGKYARLGARAPKGVLLVGPPGTGKTLLARATSGEADAAFFSLSGAEFVESLVGVGAARVRDLFKQARKQAPAIIFIDELDAAGRKRGAGVGQGNDEREQTLNQLLVEMDGFGGDAGLVVMAATNRPDILDPALLRPGRFDRQVTIDVPDVHGRLDILRLYCAKRPLAPGSSLEMVAKLTPGFSGAELANVVNEASLLAVREGSQDLTQALLEEAIDRVVSGPAKKSHVLTPDELWVIAVHEASHAVVTRSIGQKVSAQKLSVVARGRTLGTAAHMLTDRDKVVMQEPDLKRQLTSIVAGAAGEQLEFGCLSTGVHDDLHAATQLARSMVTSFGMSQELGLVTIGEAQGEVFLGASLQELGSVGPSTLDLIDREVERLCGEAEARASVVLERNWQAVRETAEALIEQETLSGVALDAVLSTVQTVSLADLEGVQRRINRKNPSAESA